MESYAPIGDALICIATATLLYLNSWIRLRKIPGDVEYHVKRLAFDRVLQATVWNAVLASLILFGVFWLGRMIRQRPIGETAQLFVIFLFGMATLRFASLLTPFEERLAEVIGNAFLAEIAAILAVSSVIFGSFPETRLLKIRRLAIPAAAIWLIAFTAMAVPVGQALRVPRSIATPDTNRSSRLSPATGWNAERNIVWVIFDELDGEVAFTRRPGFLQLPSLDRLRTESVYFAAAKSPSDQTITALPSLLTGLPLTKVIRKEESDLLLGHRDSGEPYSFRRTPNVIDWATEAGLPVTLIGWAHPYCRLFGDRIAQCSWYEFGQMSFAQNWASALQKMELLEAISAEASFEAKAGETLRCPDGKENYAFSFQVDDVLRSDVEEILAQQRRDIKEFMKQRQHSLTILHLASPHPPAISAPTEIIPGRAGESSDLAGNYEIADSILGEIRALLEAREQWDSSLVIVTSDHGLRDFWGHWGCLSERDRDLLSRRDSNHVPMMVKWPGQTRPVVRSEPRSTLLIAPTVHRYVNGDLNSQEDFLTSLEQNEASPEH